MAILILTFLYHFMQFAATHQANLLILCVGTGSCAAYLIGYVQRPQLAPIQMICFTRVEEECGQWFIDVHAKLIDWSR